MRHRSVTAADLQSTEDDAKIGQFLDGIVLACHFAACTRAESRTDLARLAPTIASESRIFTSASFDLAKGSLRHLGRKDFHYREES